MRKGQAAMEFLTTYGLSFMILISAIGGLTYFGVFDVTNFVSDTCELGSYLFCPVYALADDGTGDYDFSMQLDNGGVNNVNITTLSIKDIDSDTYCPSTNSVDTVIAPGHSQDLTFNFDVNGACASSFVKPGIKRKYDLRLYFYEDDASRRTSVNGKLIIRASS